MASKFWGGGSSDEEEEPTTEEETSSEGTDSDSDDEKDQKRNQFLAGSSDSDSEGGRRRPVKSAKDRCYDELQSICDEIRNKLNINDWSSIQTLFDKLNKQLEKTQKVTQTSVIPRRYIKALVEIEDTVNRVQTDKDAKKKMSPTNAKAFNSTRQRLKKHNAQYQELIDKYRENPETSEEESEEEESDVSEVSGDEEIGAEPVEAGKKEPLLTMDPADVTYEMVSKKLAEINQNRGKKGVNKQEQVEMLNFLATIAKGPVQKIEILLQCVPALFDLQTKAKEHIPVHIWKQAVAILLDIVAILQEHTYIVIDERAEALTVDDRTEEPEPGEEAKIRGNLVGHVERLDDELFKSLQLIDPHTHEYKERLKDEILFLALAYKVAQYLESRSNLEGRAQIALRQLEHIYYKTDAVYDSMRKLILLEQQAPAEDAVEAAKEDGAEDGDETVVGVKVSVRMPADFVLPESNQSLMDELTELIFKYGVERSKARAMLCAIFFQCIHNQYYKGRDILLMSHLQDQAPHMDISTQILYNRTLAQLGLCAFRAGLIPEAHQALMEIYGTGRVKELLAQGMSSSRYQDKTPEQEVQERRRQMPFHMHINLELLESVYLISAMLLEVPNMAANTLDSKAKLISRPLRRLLDNYDRQTFTGPPENVRDHVMAATRELMAGEWRKSYNYLTSLTVWSLIPQKDSVLSMLRSRLQEEGLRTYLLTYSGLYNSLSLEQLCELFELSPNRAHSVISKMMIDELLHGSWDQPTRTIIMHHSDPNNLERLAISFTNKVSVLVDLNERAFALRTGSGLHEQDEEGGGRGYGEGGQYQGRRSGRGGGPGRIPIGSMGGGGRGGRGGRGPRTHAGRYGGNYGTVYGYERMSRRPEQPSMTALRRPSYRQSTN